MTENLARIGLVSQRSQGGHHSDSRHRQELEQTGVNRCDKVHQPIKPSDAEHTQYGTNRQSDYPKYQLFCLFLTTTFAFHQLFHYSNTVINNVNSCKNTKKDL